MGMHAGRKLWGYVASRASKELGAMFRTPVQIFIPTPAWLQSPDSCHNVGRHPRQPRPAVAVVLVMEEEEEIFGPTMVPLVLQIRGCGVFTQSRSDNNQGRPI